MSIKMIKVFHLLLAGQLILLFMLKLSYGNTELLLDYSLPLVDNDTEFADFTHMKVVHYNRTLKVYAGNVTYFVDVDDNYQIETLLYKSNGNHYEILPFKFRRQNFCEHVNNSTEYDYLRTRSNIPAKGVCPWPKGTYKFYGHLYNNQELLTLFEGKFMLQGRYYKKDVLLNGYQIYFTLLKEEFDQK